MAGKRISELTEQTGLSSGDFFGVDNAGQTASKKIDQAYFTGQYSDMNNILGSKNLMPNNAVTVVLRGVTWTINSDGTIKANGTASGGDSTLYYVSSSNDATAGITIPEGKYTYTCLTSAGSDSTFRSEIYNLTNSYRIGWDYGEGVTFTRTAATKVLGSINIRSGQTVTNEIFKPMLRPAAVADPTYVPYAKSNKELTDDVATLNSSLTAIPSNFVVTTKTNISASSAAGHGWDSGSITKDGYIALMVTYGGGYGYTLQPVLEAIYGLGTDTVRILGTASNTGTVYAWILWIKEDLLS